MRGPRADVAGLPTLLPTASSEPEWPHRTLDIGRARLSGWRPTPFRDFVLKIHQRCNLSCDYCYVYTMADQSWRDRPISMSPEVWRAAADRIVEHASEHRLPQIRVILHGGEPLLLGRERLDDLLTDLSARIGNATCVEFQVQTNGLLLSDDMLAVMRRHTVRVGISLDGAAAANDRHRRFADGRGSSDGVDRALRRMMSPPNDRLFAGVLATVDIDQDPVECYESLGRYRPPSIDFLLPHASWSDPPRKADDTVYGDWLAAAFDRWYDERPQTVEVRLFNDIIRLILGGSGGSEQVGLSPVAVAVVESDGAVEQVDSLKSAYPGACATGLSVFTDRFDAAWEHPGVVARQLGLGALCNTCRSCELHTVCGAGHYAHRYRVGDGFLNPTVYCADMTRLIRHVIRRVSDDVRQRLAASDRD